MFLVELSCFQIRERWKRRTDHPGKSHLTCKRVYILLRVATFLFLAMIFFSSTFLTGQIKVSYGICLLETSKNDWNVPTAGGNVMN